MFPLIVSEIDKSDLCGEFSRFDCHGVVCVSSIMSQCGGSVSLSQFRIQRRIMVPKISSIIQVGQCGGSRKIPPGNINPGGITNHTTTRHWVTNPEPGSSLLGPTQDPSVISQTAGR